MALNLNTNQYTSTNLIDRTAVAIQQAALLERPALLTTLTTLVHLLREQVIDAHVDLLFQLNVALALTDPTPEETNTRTLAIHHLVMNEDLDSLVDYVADLPTPGVQENAPSAGVRAGGRSPLPPVAGRSTRNTPAPKALTTPTQGTVKSTSWRWLKGYLVSRVRQARKGRTMDMDKSYPLNWWLKTCAVSGIRAKASYGAQPRLMVLDRDGTTWLSAKLS